VQLILSPEEKTLIIGIGNEYRSDDGVGLVVARRLRPRVGDAFAVIEQTGEGASLIEAWRGAGSVIVIDAVTSGAEPGTIHRFEANTETLPKSLFRYSTHAFSLAEAIELARALGELPSRLVVYGIEANDFTAGVGLSSAVDEAARQLEELLFERSF
jgi:hydrogenase maturation protease